MAYVELHARSASPAGTVRHYIGVLALIARQHANRSRQHTDTLGEETLRYPTGILALRSSESLHKAVAIPLFIRGAYAL